ncbi:MAG: zinc-ribbon domain-containing protein [Candidatus Binatia bacterium]
MLVSCPSCSTTYRVSDKLITTPNPTFRCSRCKHIFILELKNETITEKAPPLQPPETQQEEKEQFPELDFSFPSTSTDTTEHKTEEGPQPTEETQPPVTESQDREPEDSLPTEETQPPATDSLDQEPEDSYPTEETQTPVTESQDQEPSEPPSPKSEEPFVRQEESEEETRAYVEAALQSLSPSTPRHWDEDSKTEEKVENLTFQEEEGESGSVATPRKGGGISVLPYFSLFGILLLIFSVVTLAYQASPTRLESFIKAIPWFGPMVIKNNHLRDGIMVQSLRSGIMTIVGGRKVFVISGEVVNRTQVSVGEIRVEGQTYTEGGEEIESQAISIGNPISKKIIRDMTAREISILQRLSPQKKYEIPPDKSATFTIVFLKPPDNVKAFSCKVLSAEGAA